MAKISNQLGKIGNGRAEERGHRLCGAGRGKEQDGRRRDLEHK